MKTRLNVLLSLWWLFVMLGVASIVGSLAAERHQESRGRHGPVLLHPAAIAVSGTGDLFVYSNFREIRVFSVNGDLLRSWPIETFRGAVRMTVDATGNLRIGTVRNERYYQFDASGHLLQEEHNIDAFEKLPPDSFYRARGPNGSAYEIRDSAVVRVDGEANVSTIVPGPPSYLSFFFGGPPRSILLVHGALMVLFGLALAYVGRSQRQRAAA